MDFCDPHSIIMTSAGMNYIFVDFINALMLANHSQTVAVLLFYVHGKHLRSCRDGQLTEPHFSWAGLDLLSG